MNGNWPTHIYDEQKELFDKSLGTLREEEFAPLQNQITNHKHPWNIISTVILIGGGLIIINLTKVFESAALPIAIITGLGFFKSFSIAQTKNKALGIAKTQLDEYVQTALGIDIKDVSQTYSAILHTFQSLGFIGRFEDVHYISAIAPKSMSDKLSKDFLYHPIGTKLTRTEIENYKDSKGRSHTRRRVVKVFEGLMLEMEIEDNNTDNRILINARRHHGFSGPFDRVKNGRRHKMDNIKTSSLEFNKAYEVTTDDQTLAHLFLDPDHIMRFINLNADLRQMLSKKHVPISILITQGKLWVALETSGLPSISGFSSNPEKLDNEIHKIIAQAALPQIIARHLNLPNPVQYAWQS